MSFYLCTHVVSNISRRLEQIKANFCKDVSIVFFNSIMSLILLYAEMDGRINMSERLKGLVKHVSKTMIISSRGPLNTILQIFYVTYSFAILNNCHHENHHSSKITFQIYIRIKAPSKFYHD